MKFKTLLARGPKLTVNLPWAETKKLKAPFSLLIFLGNLSQVLEVDEHPPSPNLASIYWGLPRRLQQSLTSTVWGRDAVITDCHLLLELQSPFVSRVVSPIHDRTSLVRRNCTAPILLMKLQLQSSWGFAHSGGSTELFKVGSWNACVLFHGNFFNILIWKRLPSHSIKLGKILWKDRNGNVLKSASLRHTWPVSEQSPLPLPGCVSVPKCFA